MPRKIFTSESVTSGHPDKICDYIADSILDEALAQDPYANMAVEATIKDDFVLIYGEANTKAILDYEAIAKKAIQEIGYQEDYTVLCKVNRQSDEIHAAVNQNELGAGDQGIMFGYACDETPTYMPFAIALAHKLAQQLETVRRKNPLLRPDGKTQVSVIYEDDMVVGIDTIVVSCQHDASLCQDDLKAIILKDVITPCVDAKYLSNDTKYLINPSGSFVLGGSFGDSGTTGRKIVVDSYGGYAPIGGGCFSSKDPTKVDRSAAYYSRYVARNIIANGLAKKCLIELSYAIGYSHPVSIHIDTYKTGLLDDETLIDVVLKNFNFDVQAMIEELDLRKPIYRKTTNYGHFGKADLPWEAFKKIVY